MNGRVSFSVTTVAVTLGLVAALMGGYLMGGGSGTGGGVALAASEPGADTSTIEMRGTGHATAVPDQLTFSLGVEVTEAELDQALDRANRRMTAMLAAIREHGVEDRDIQTSGLSMRPKYQHVKGSPSKLVGYRVSERVRVIVRDLPSGGEVISAAVEAGGNNARVDDIRLSVSDPDDVLAQARAAAVEEATTKAEEYAEATGRTLGAVVAIREPGRDSPMYAQGERFSELTADSAVPIQAGESELAATVEVVWELE